MAKNKGLVLEITHNKVIVLTPDGQFLERKITGKVLQVGSEIDLSAFNTNRQNWLILGVAAVFALIFIPLLALQLFIYPQMTVAYVTVDINPSIELGLNKYDKVISSQGLNQDGIDLLNKMKLNNLPVDEALEIVTEEAINAKYINVDKENAIIISYSEEKPIKKTSPQTSPKQEPQIVEQETLENKVKQVIARNQQEAIVEMVHVSPKVRIEASELGLSTGKYTLMLEAWDEGLEISPESMKVNNIISAIKEKGVNPDEFISQVQKKNYSVNELENLTFKYEAKINELKSKGENEVEKVAEQPDAKIEKEDTKATMQNPSSYGIGNDDDNTASKDGHENSKIDSKEKENVRSEIINEEITDDSKPDKNEKTNRERHNEVDGNINRSNQNSDQSKNEIQLETKKRNDSNITPLEEEANNRIKDKDDGRPSMQDEYEAAEIEDQEMEKGKEKEKEKQDSLDGENTDKGNKESQNSDKNLKKDSEEQGKTSNTKLDEENIRKYQGLDMENIPKNIRLLLLELLKNRNR